jgi:hypothetical protein
VPVYNVERYVRTCLDSIIGQTLTSIEIICVDDGSTDTSGAILDELAAGDSRLRVIHQKNGGYGAAVNRGLMAARASYLGIVESDDWIDPAMYARLLELAQKHQLDVCKSAFFISTTKDEVRDVLYNEVPHELAQKVLLPSQHRELFWYQPSVWSALYRRGFLEENGIRFAQSPGAAYQDTGFSMKVLCAAERYYYEPQAWLHYRSDNPESSVHSRAKVFAVGDEMAQARAYAREHLYGARQQACLAQLWSISFGLDVWNLKRIDATFQREYLTHMQTVYRQGAAAGEMNASLLPGLYRMLYLLMRQLPGVFLALVGRLPKSGMRRKARSAQERLKKSL